MDHLGSGLVDLPPLIPPEHLLRPRISGSRAETRIFAAALAHSLPT